MRRARDLKLVEDSVAISKVWAFVVVERLLREEGARTLAVSYVGRLRFRQPD